VNDFDLRLRQRLQRLEAAVPEPVEPTRHIAARRLRRRHVAIVALAAIMVLGAGSFVALGSLPPPSPAEVAINTANERRLSQDLESRWPPCATEAQARALVTERLVALGLADWTFRLDRDSLVNAPCVGAAALGPTHQVMLHPLMGERVNDALEALKVDLLSRCLNRTEALDLLRSTLQAAGVSEPQVAVVGVRITPASESEKQAYLKHVAAGCVVFSDAQSDQTGRYTWSLASR
jgi:hypothetical protein